MQQLQVRFVLFSLLTLQPFCKIHYCDHSARKSARKIPQGQRTESSLVDVIIAFQPGVGMMNSGTVTDQENFIGPVISKTRGSIFLMMNMKKWLKTAPLQVQWNCNKKKWKKYLARGIITTRTNALLSLQTINFHDISAQQNCFDGS